MPEPAQLLYLEPDDEITSVVRRLRETDAQRVVLVAPGRSRATASAVALRLLAGVASEEGREVALVADAAGRALAAEAGIPVYASVAEASAEGARPIEAEAPRRAPIRVVRGESPPAAAGLTDETQPVPVAVPASQAPPRPPGQRVAGSASPARTRGAAVWQRLPRAVIGALIALVLLGGALVAAIAPSATIVIEPASFPIDDVSYSLTMSPAGIDQGELSSELEGSASGVFTDPSPATGTVTFLNWNTVIVEVPAGTVVAAGELTFETAETIRVPIGSFQPLTPGRGSVGVVAMEPGPAGNVEADAIDAIVTRSVQSFLRGHPLNPNRLVTNAEPTSGGSENRQPEITQGDVDMVVAAVQADLAAQLDEALDEDASRLYGPVEAGQPEVNVPDDLVGRRGEEAFTLAGTLEYRRPFLERSAVEAAARERLLQDAEVVPEGSRIVPGSVGVEIGQVMAASGGLRVEVRLAAEAVPEVNVEVVREQVAGLTDTQVVAQLRPLGDVSVRLWPDWVDRVPELDWRIEVEVVGHDDALGPVPSGSGG